MQRAQGFETSVSGEPIRNLSLTAGLLLGDVRIDGPNLKAEGVGPIAFGQPHVQGTLSLDYKLERVPGLSIDATVLYYGHAPASVNNLLENPSQALLFIRRPVSLHHFRQASHSSSPASECDQPEFLEHRLQPGFFGISA